MHTNLGPYSFFLGGIGFSKKEKLLRKTEIYIVLCFLTCTEGASAGCSALLDVAADGDTLLACCIASRRSGEEGLR